MPKETRPWVNIDNENAEKLLKISPSKFATLEKDRQEKLIKNLIGIRFRFQIAISKNNENSYRTIVDVEEDESSDEQ